MFDEFWFEDFYSSLLERFAFEKNPFAVKMTKRTVLRIDITTLDSTLLGNDCNFLGWKSNKAVKDKIKMIR